MIRSSQNTVHTTQQTLSKVLALITVTGLIIGGYFTVQSFQTNQSKPKETGLFNPLISSEQLTPTSTAAPLKTTSKKLDKEKLKNTINEIIKAETPVGKEWIVGVSITDLETKEQLHINESESFDAASVGKVPILLALYDQIEKGQFKESDTITITDKEIQDYGTGSLRYKKTPMTLTVKELAELMMKQSDNTAAYVLATKAGRDNIKQYVSDIGMINSDTTENTTTPYDTNLMFIHLYDMKNKNARLSGALMNMMTDSIFEQRLPSLLPKETIVAHKIGTGVAQIHDAGIVVLDNRPFAISVFTKKVNDEKKAEEIIAKIAKASYDEFVALQ